MIVINAKGSLSRKTFYNNSISKTKADGTGTIVIFISETCTIHKPLL